MQRNWNKLSARWISAIVTLIFPLLVNCSASDQPSSGAELESSDVAAEPLVNGRVSKDKSVGVVTCSVCNTQCTGTLIGRRTVLTAAHCVQSGQSAKFCTFPCGNAGACAGTCSSGVAQRDPGYDGGFDHDVAVIRLNQDVAALSGATPKLIGGLVQEGAGIALTGYGCSDPDNTNVGIGQQRWGENFVADVHDQTIDYDDESRAYSCPGDSGGLASPTTALSCEIGVIVGSYWLPFDNDYELTRVDTKLPWIEQTANDPSVHECGHPLCGDGLCQSPETNCTCAVDCSGVCPPPPSCGDGVCNGTESTKTCPKDCPFGTCSGGKVDCCDDGVCRSAALCKKLGCL